MRIFTKTYLFGGQVPKNYPFGGSHDEPIVSHCIFLLWGWVETTCFECSANDERMIPVVAKSSWGQAMGQTWGITVQVSLKALRSQGMMGRWYPRCVESRCLLEIRFKRWAARTFLRVSKRKLIFYTESIGWIHIYVGCICWCLRHSLIKPFMLIKTKIPFLVGWIPCSDLFRWYLKTAVFCC